jgi:segregation and condensation protein A
MPEEQDILKAIIEKESWEEVLYYIVNVQNMDPWNIDLVKLTESFMNFLKSAKDLDFRIPAKIVFVAAILLRLKADYLSIFEEKESEIEEALREQRPFEELGIDPNLVKLGYPMKRIPKRQVTMDELIVALKKAMTVDKRREDKRANVQARVEAQLKVEEGIEQRIESVMGDIESLLKSQDKVEFRQIVGDWKRDKVVERFVPVLHLEQDKKISAEQEEFFKRILISKYKEKAEATST